MASIIVDSGYGRGSFESIEDAQNAVDYAEREMAHESCARCRGQLTMAECEGA